MENDWQSDFQQPLTDLYSYNDEARFVALNETYIAYAVAGGAVLILIAAVGLYLYDYYYGTSRTDPVVQPEYSQYYTDAEAYNQYLYDTHQR